MANFAVCTAIVGTGVADTLQPQTQEFDNVDFFCFTNRDWADAGLWKIRPVSGGDNPRRVARHCKTCLPLLLENYDYCLWMDGCFRLKVNPWSIARDVLSETTHMAAFKHESRDSVYDEYKACVRLKKDDPETMRKQVARYRAAGYPEGAGLAETGCVLRRNVPSVRTFSSLWWEEVAAGSVRDQLSFDFVCWSLGMKYATYPGIARSNRDDGCPYFEWHPHR